MISHRWRCDRDVIFGLGNLATCSGSFSAWLRFAIVSCAILTSGLVLAGTQPADAASATQKKVCSRALERRFLHSPRHVTTAPPAALTSILGVLRRPATPVDKLPAEALAGIVPYAYSALWLGSVRLLDTVGDKRYFLIPGVYDPPPFPEVCVKLEQPHVRHLLQKGPQIGPHGPVVTLEPYSSHQTGGIPFTASEIQAGTANEPALGRSGSTTTFYGLVPDGVASVTVTAGGASPTTAPVANNFFLTQIPAPSAGKPYTITQQWYAANGTLITTVSKTTVLQELSGRLGT
jgi:hypothetical protein